MEQEPTFKFYSKKEAMKTCSYCPRNVQYLRERRNKLLQETDFYLLPDVVIDENKLNIKKYRQDLRNFINRFVNDEIICGIMDDDIELKYFPKLVLDGTAQT